MREFLYECGVILPTIDAAVADTVRRLDALGTCVCVRVRLVLLNQNVCHFCSQLNSSSLDHRPSWTLCLKRAGGLPCSLTRCPPVAPTLIRWRRN